jgi:hypothetical protein
MKYLLSLTLLEGKEILHIEAILEVSGRVTQNSTHNSVEVEVEVKVKVTL